MRTTIPPCRANRRLSVCPLTALSNVSHVISAEVKIIGWLGKNNLYTGWMYETALLYGRKAVFLYHLPCRVTFSQ